MEAPEKTFRILPSGPTDPVHPIGAGEWCSIFNTPEFFHLHVGQRRGVFLSLLPADSDAVIGRAHFVETTPGRFVSPVRGTFGGFDLASSDVQTVEAFVDGAEQRLREIGARAIEVALMPFAHSPALNSVVFNVLLRRGYRIEVQDLSYAMEVRTQPLIERMQRNNQKKLRKCQREGFIVAKCEQDGERRAAYAAVAKNRESRGYAISMTYEQLAEMDRVFSGRIHYFSVTHQAETIAGSVCIELNPAVLYVFYWGDVPGFEVFSPVVLLADYIYSFAQSQGFKQLDVGRSTEAGVPNHGLIRFKEKLGFEASLKLTVAKELT